MAGTTTSGGTTAGTPTATLPNEAADALVAAARGARRAAYAPYSRFRVGAAALMRRAGGGEPTVFTGANVENSSYGLAICAERVAVPHGVAQGATELLAIAVVAEPLRPGEPIPPCGACLQVIAEFGRPETPIVLAAPTGPWQLIGLADLLPRAFRFDGPPATPGGRPKDR